MHHTIEANEDTSFESSVMATIESYCINEPAAHAAPITGASTDADADAATDQKVARSAFGFPRAAPGRRAGYVRKGPVQSDSDEDDENEVDNINGNDDESEDENTSFPHADRRVDGLLKPFSQTRLSTGVAVKPGQNYVRKAPLNSDTESDEESQETAVSASSPQSSKLLTPTSEPKDSDDDTDSESNKPMSNRVSRTPGRVRVAGPGQNYVRKAPVDSDTESDEDRLDGKPTTGLGAGSQRNESLSAVSIKTGSTTSLASASNTAPYTNAQLSKTTTPSSSTTTLLATSEMAAPTLPLGRAIHMPVNGINGFAASSPSLAPEVMGAGLIGLQGSPVAGSTINYMDPNSSAAVSLAGSMAIYQQQQQEMMMIVQQQQLQIATMQQQQQAYQIMLLQQQHQHQHQLQSALAKKDSHASGENTETTSKTDEGDSKENKTSDDDDDDDTPLGEKLQHSSQAPPQLQPLSVIPTIPQFAPLVPPTPMTPPTMSMQLPYTAFSTPPTAAHLSPLLQQQYVYTSPSLHQSPQPRNRSRQTSNASLHSIHSVSSAPALYQQYVPVNSSPLMHHSVPSLYQHHQLSNSQSRLASLIEEEQARVFQEQQQQQHLMLIQQQQNQVHQHQQQLQFQQSALTQSVSAPSLLTSSFPAGYRHSMSSITLGQLQQDRGSMTSLHSTGSNGSNNSAGSNGSGGHGPSATKAASAASNPARQSMVIMPSYQTSQPQPQQPLVGMGASPSPYHPQNHFMHAGGPAPQQYPTPHHTLIHVEAKPPPPQTGLVGAITAMERDKKLAKAQGTNQLQYQYQQQQQQQHAAMAMTAEKERWLQEQRRIAWETSQMGQQQPMGGA
ncbi:hypothetical protein BGW38_003303, partial [Lunasporangiospora selenospora]